MQEKQAELGRFHRDVVYYQVHREELLKEYPEQWVAIFNEQVVGASPDYDQVLDQVQAKHIAVGRVFIDRVTAKDELLILRA